MKNIELTFLRDIDPFKKDDKIIVKALQYGFIGGFEGNSHGGQWTTDGSVEPCVIVEYQKCELTEKNNNIGFVKCLYLVHVNLVNLDCVNEN